MHQEDLNQSTEARRTVYIRRYEPPLKSRTVPVANSASGDAQVQDGGRDLGGIGDTFQRAVHPAAVVAVAEQVRVPQHVPFAG